MKLGFTGRIKDSDPLNQVSPVRMNCNLVRLVLGARVVSLWRVTAAIASAEPVWFALVGVVLFGGGAVAVRQLEPRQLTLVLSELAVVLTLLLSVTRRDARLLRIIGVSPWLARVVEGLLWSCPLIGLAALYSLRDSAVMVGSVAAVALITVDVRGIGTTRGVPRPIPMIPMSLPEWTVGLRQSAPLMVLALLTGIVGSGSPGVVVLAVMVLGLTTSAYFWAPAEGWILIHAAGDRAGAFLSRKLLASVGMLAALVVPIVLLGALRTPQLWLVYAVALGMCLHAHAAAVLVKYATYREGEPLEAAGTLIWMITAASILLPPVGIVLLVWLFRRAAARLADFCHDPRYAI